MSLSIADLRKAMANKTNEELYDVLYGHSADYTADAIEAARSEFSSRHLDAPTKADLKIAVESNVEREEAPLSWRLRILAFFISTMFFFIPLMLAHRRYVERGEMRKARDWARWAWLGLAFYIFSAILLRVLAQLSS